MNDGEEIAVAVAREALTVVANAPQVHAELFAAHPEAAVKTVSRLEREAKVLPQRSLAYGEIPFATVDEIFQLMRAEFGVLLDRGGSFYDLGSGCGKVVMAAALLHDFSKCCGVEILDGLHAIALKVLDEWRYKVLDTLHAAKADVDVGFTKADATQSQIWNDATLVICNATCFSDSLVQTLSTAADVLKDGSYFVTITKPLASERWKIMLERRLPMSWGMATVVIHKKTS